MNFFLLASVVLGISLYSSDIANASQSCQSYSKTVKRGENICFAKTNYMYGCTVWQGKPEFNYVMTLSFNARLRDKGGVCDNIDTTNIKPNGTPYGTKINRDRR